MLRLPCPFLHAEVELSAEREAHILERHPELGPGHLARIAETLVAPHTVRRSVRFATARLFTRWYDDARAGKHVVAVVVSDAGPTERHWIVTAYIARKLVEGDVEWPTS